MSFNTDTTGSTMKPTYVANSNHVPRGSVLSHNTSTYNSNSTDGTSSNMVRSPSSTKMGQPNNTDARPSSISRKQSFTKAIPFKLAKMAPSLSRKKTDGYDAPRRQQPHHITDSPTSYSHRQHRNSDSIGTISASLVTVKNGITNRTRHQRTQSNSGEMSPIYQQHQQHLQHQQQPTKKSSRLSLDMTRKTDNSRSTSFSVHGNGYDANFIRHSNHGPIYQQDQQHPTARSPLLSLDKTRKSSTSTPASSTVYDTKVIRHSDYGPILNTPISPPSASTSKQHQAQRPLYCDLSAGYPMPHQQRRLSSTLSVSKQIKADKTTPPSPSLLQHTRKTPLRAATLPTLLSIAPPSSGLDSDNGTCGYGHTKTNSSPKMDSRQQIHSNQHTDPESLTLDHSQHRCIEYDHRPNHHYRQSLISNEARPSTILARRRSLADASSRSYLTSSPSSASSSLLLASPQQHRTQIAQARLRHPSWLDSAGFMRPSKCSACNPDPPAKTSIITPPVGVGVPAFGPPPDSTYSTSPKYSFSRRLSSPSLSVSRGSVLCNKRSKHDQHYEGTFSSSIALEGNGRKENNGVDHVDGMTRMNQNRRLSSSNLGTQVDQDRRRLSSPNVRRSLQHVNLTTANKCDGGRHSLYDRPITHVNYTHHSWAPNSHNRKMTLNITGSTTSGSESEPAHTLPRQSSFPRLDMNTSLSRSPPSSATANTTAASSNEYSSYASLSTSVPDCEMTTRNVKMLLSQLLRPEHANLLGNTQVLLEKDTGNQPQLYLPVAMNDIIQRGGLVQDHLLGLEQQLQALLDITQSSSTNTSNTKHHLQHQAISGLSSATLVAEEDNNSLGKQCVSSSPSVSNLESASTGTELLNHYQQQQQWQQVLSTPGADMEQWIAKIRLTLGRLLTDLNHGYLKNYETAPDGSITTMTITGHVITVEPSLLSQLFVTYKSKTSSSPMKKNRIHHQYTLSISSEERRRSFGFSSPELWISDEQVNYCQFKTKSVHCECEFTWMNRRHHCRRCGNIFCKAHSSNRLPLFTEENPNQVKWSRVCDSCCYHMVGPYLVEI